jgi:hypothetical protein
VANERQVTPEVVREHGLNDQEYDLILDIMGREPNLLELGIFSVMWSEHCSYKSSKKWLKTLPTKGPQVIKGPGENAGVIDIGEGLAAIFKMESHNHPSFIEPYQGAATGVGGILRDVFTMGARPVANLNALRFGAPDHPKTRHLVAGVVSGIGGYGNCVGAPTVGGEVNFDASYSGNILVNAMTVGIAPADRIFYSAAAGVGQPVVYVGSKTGRDGIHGATMASAEFDENLPGDGFGAARSGAHHRERARRRQPLARFSSCRRHALTTAARDVAASPERDSPRLPPSLQGLSGTSFQQLGLLGGHQSSLETGRHPVPGGSNRRRARTAGGAADRAICRSFPSMPGSTEAGAVAGPPHAR